MDKKNGFRNFCMKLLKHVGLMSPGEELDPDTAKTKIVFAISQMVISKYQINIKYKITEIDFIECRFILCLQFSPHHFSTAATD